MNCHAMPARQCGKTRCKCQAGDRCWISTPSRAHCAALAWGVRQKWPNETETEMLKKRRVPRVLLSLALLAPWGALRAVPGVTDTEIVIGQSLGLTGTANVGAVLPLLAK